MRAATRLVLASLVSLAVLAIPSTAWAMSFRSAQGGEAIVIGPGETIDDDLYVVGSTIEIRGTVRGSVFAAGTLVSVDGTVGGDVWAAGTTVRVGADTSGTVHAAGTDVSVSGRIGRDVTAAGTTVRLAEEAQVGRDAALAGTTVESAGSIGRDLYGGASRMTVSGSVERDVRGGFDDLTIADGARIGGDVLYRSDNEARVERGATVGGSVRRSPAVGPRRMSPAERAIWAFIGWIRRLIGLALFGLLVVSLFPLFSRRASDDIARDALASTGIGFAVLFLTPVALMLVFLIGLLVGGWWIALMGLALYIIAVAVATVVTSLFLGRLILGRLAHRPGGLIGPLLLGLLLLTLLEAVPFLGALVRLAEVVVGLGAAVLAIVRRTDAAVPASQAPPPPMTPV